MRVLTCFILCISITLLNYTVLEAQEKLIPQPQEWKSNSGSFTIKPGRWRFSDVMNGADINNEIVYLKEQMKSRFKIDLQSSNAKIVELSISQILPNFPEAEREGYYKLDVGNEGISISFGKPSGLFYGIQTLLQLVEIYEGQGEIPCQSITDYPKFSYRGMHLDVSRHFFSVDEVKKYLDYLAAYKINKFHWHLTDDQGWRIEIKSHPKLTEIGAYRTIKPGQNYTADKIVNGKYGGFYTQEEIKDVVKYAAKLHIDVIPEIEMPGHAQAALAAYPELSCTGGPFEVWTEWGVSENIYCPKEETFAFLQDVIDEVIPLFPSEYIHIGGDEAPKAKWKSCAYCQELMKKEGLKDEHELQSYFIKRIEKYVNGKGKRIIGWDEILEGGLAPNATVMSWTGQEGAIHTAKQGNDAIMTPASHLYFDYYQGNAETEPLAFNAELRMEKTYSFNPIPDVLNAEEAKHILGPQANLWTEHIQDFKGVEYMIFPRLFALSEVGWGTSKPTDYADFERRVINRFDYLDKEGINYSKAIFEVSGSTFSDNGKNYFALKGSNPNFKIRYTIDGSDPNATSLVYQNPIEMDKTMTIKAANFEGKKQISSVLQQDFRKSKSTSKPVVLLYEPSPPYIANGTSSLVDGIYGHPNSFTKN